MQVELKQSQMDKKISNRKVLKKLIQLNKSFAEGQSTILKTFKQETNQDTEGMKYRKKLQQ